MARKRNEEYIGEDDDGEFEEEPFESYEDPPDFVDEVTDEGERPRIQKNVEAFFDMKFAIFEADFASMA